MECYHNKFSGIQCQKEAEWAGSNTDNFTDLWTWCNDHKPPSSFSRLLNNVAMLRDEEWSRDVAPAYGDLLKGE